MSRLPPPLRLPGTLHYSVGSTWKSGWFVRPTAGELRLHYLPAGGALGRQATWACRARSVQTVFDTDSSGRQWLGGRSAGASLLVHVIAILLVFLVGGPVTQLVVRPHAVAWITAPPPAKRLAPPPSKQTFKLPVRPPSVSPHPIAFNRPVVLVLKLPVIALPAAPVVEPSRGMVPPPDMVPAPIPFTPAIKTGEFSQATRASPSRLSQPRVETSVFNAPENPHPPHTAPRDGRHLRADSIPRPQRRIDGSRVGFHRVDSRLLHQLPPHPPKSGAVTRGAFGDAAREVPSAAVLPQRPATQTTPAEILSKPRPAYTEEARALAIQGVEVPG